MNDPLYIVIGRPNPNDKETITTIRLESGNHRIKEALLDGVTHLLCYAIIQSYSIYHTGNGHHKIPIDPRRVEDYYLSLGRNSELFEPCPHPADLKVMFPELDIFFTGECQFEGEVEDGIYAFSPNP